MGLLGFPDDALGCAFHVHNTLGGLLLGLVHLGDSLTVTVEAFPLGAVQHVGVLGARVVRAPLLGSHFLEGRGLVALRPGWKSGGTKPTSQMPPQCATACGMVIRRPSALRFRHSVTNIINPLCFLGAIFAGRGKLQGCADTVEHVCVRARQRQADNQ